MIKIRDKKKRTNFLFKSKKMFVNLNRDETGIKSGNRVYYYWH